MSTTTKLLFGTSNQAITCTITSLANNAARQATVVDNTTNLFLDALVFATVKTNAAGTSATGTCVIYAAGTVDGGTTFTENAVGPDGSITLTSPTNARVIGVGNLVANAITYYIGPFSVAAAFGGTLPQKWNIIFLNSSGATLDASVGSLYYQGINLQNV